MPTAKGSGEEDRLSDLICGRMSSSGSASGDNSCLSVWQVVLWVDENDLGGESRR